MRWVFAFDFIVPNCPENLISFSPGGERRCS
jgi:hypothetical protein